MHTQLLSQMLHTVVQIVTTNKFKKSSLEILRSKQKAEEEINPLLLKIANYSTMQTSLERNRLLFYITSGYCYELTVH